MSETYETYVMLKPLELKSPKYPITCIVMVKEKVGNNVSFCPSTKWQCKSIQISQDVPVA